MFIWHNFYDSIIILYYSIQRSNAIKKIVDETKWMASILKRRKFKLSQGIKHYKSPTTIIKPVCYLHAQFAKYSNQSENKEFLMIVAISFVRLALSPISSKR